MDFAVVTSLLGIVEQQLLLQPHSSLILPDTQIIPSLSEKLRFLQAFLDQYELEIFDFTEKRVLGQNIKAIAVEAEDRIESKLREVYLAANKKEGSVEACQDLHQTLQQVVKDIESVDACIKDLQRRHTASLDASSTPSLELESIADGGFSKHKLEPENVMTRLEYELFVTIRDMLIYGRSSQQEVISIVGKGGAGKTILARRVYHDPLIVSHFHVRAWTTVSENFSKRKVVTGILGCIGPLTSEISEGNDVLVDRLYKSLQGQRYLIVIDDIRALRAWDDIRMCFPNDFNGSRILITTRIARVAEYFSSTNNRECIVKVGQDLHHSTSLDGSSTPLKLEKITDSSSSQNDLELENTMIGLQDEFEKVKDALIRQQSSAQPEVISIVGVGGSGKTTLARRVYDNPLIVSHFDIQGWTTVSQDFSIRKVIIGILGCIVSLTSEISKEGIEYLKERLLRSLKGQRYLIVIDDIWALKAWNDIRICFPNDFNGSRILITTRIMQVAECVSSCKYIYHIRFLSPDESWNLFVTKVFNGKSFPHPEFESIGKNVVEKCHGLPLAIVLIAGLLAKLDKSPKQWEDFAEHMDSVLMGLEHQSVSQILALSYNDLPSQLQVCFLYLGAFPEDSDIHVKKLIKLWVAEGFLKPEMDKSLEKVAEDSLCDLIARNLVLVVKRSVDGKVKSCRLHDLLHEFCLRKAQEENALVFRNEYCNDFARTWAGTKQSQPGYRWMSCQSCRWPITQSSSLNLNSWKIRSILYFGKDLYLAKCRFEFSCLELLRVLDLSLIKYWDSMPGEIVNLIHLRYLALTTTGSLYNFQLFKLQSLQTLILFSWMEKCRLQLPCDILDLPWLRHVRLDKGSSLYLPTLVRENLQTLFWLKCAGWDSKTLDFTRVPNLKELGIYIEGEVLPDALDSLVQLHQLEKLKFELGSVEHFNLPISFPPNLKRLTLHNTYLSWKEMDVIGKLSNLEELKLKDFAFCGPEWEPRDGGFLHLKSLLIEHLDLKHWNTIADHFPVLECLVLRCCWYLKNLPYGFAHLYTLQLIELIDCCPSLVTSAMTIREEILNIGGDLLVRYFLPKDKLSKN